MAGTQDSTNRDESAGNDGAAHAQARHEALAAMPQEWRDALPRDDSGEPIVEIEYAMYTHRRTAPGKTTFERVRTLDSDEWDAVIAAHKAIFRRTRDVDRFPSFAWDDLQATRAELHRQLHREDFRPDDWMGSLVEYRLLGYSAALWMYQEYTLAEVNRRHDDRLTQEITAAFSDLYDRSRGYRIVYCLRNAFQHGVRGLVGLRAKVGFADGSDTVKVSISTAPLDKEKFAGSRANGRVRAEVRGLDEDEEVDLFALVEEAHAGVQALHRRLAPLLHPGAPEAARLLARCMREAGGERAHFHQALRGVPQAILATVTLDVTGFEYVVDQVGGTAHVDDDLTSRGVPPGGSSFAGPGA